MDKQAYLENVYNSAFNDELEKIALSSKTLISAARKAGISRAKMDAARKALKYSNARDLATPNLVRAKSRINDAISQSRKLVDKKPIRDVVKKEMDLRKTQFQYTIDRLKQAR